MRLSVIILLLIFSYNGHTQPNFPDSVQRLLDNIQSDTGRVQLLLKLAKDPATKTEFALKYLKEGLSLSKKKNYVVGKAKCLVELAKKFRLFGNYPAALDNALEALKLNESIQNDLGMIDNNIIIGVIYTDQPDFKQGRNYYFKAQDLSKKNGNAELARILIDLGDNFEKSDNLVSALSYTQQGYAQALNSKDIRFRGIALNNLGNIYSKIGQGDTAMSYYRRSLPDIIASRNDHTICETYLGMANLLNKLRKPDSVIYYAHRSLEVATANDYTKDKLNVSKFLTSYYDSVHNFDSAYAYQKISIVANDSLFSQEKIKDLQSQDLSESKRLQDIADALADERKSLKKNIQMVGIGAFIPVFFGFILLISRKKAHSKTIRFMGLFGLLLFFEFITLFLHPHIEEWTGENPVFTLLMLVVIAASLLPIHHKLEHWVIEKLAHQTNHIAQTVVEEAPKGEISQKAS